MQPEEKEMNDQLQLDFRIGKIVFEAMKKAQDEYIKANGPQYFMRGTLVYYVPILFLQKLSLRFTIETAQLHEDTARFDGIDVMIGYEPCVVLTSKNPEALFHEKLTVRVPFEGINIMKRKYE